MRTAVAIVVAAAAVAGYVALLYLFFMYLWPAFPPWLALIAFIAVAAFAIGSPIYGLYRAAEVLQRRPGDADARPRPPHSH